MMVNEEELNKIFINYENKIKETYYTKKIEEMKIDFKRVLNIVQEEIKELLFKAVDIDNSIYEKILKKTSVKKRNWIYSELNTEGSSYKKTIESSKIMFIRGSKVDNCDNLDDYIKLLNRKLNTWKSNKEPDLSKFEFIEKKRPSTIQRALSDDIKVFILKNIIEEYKKNSLKSKYEVQINSLVSTATDPTNRVALKSTKMDVYSYKYDAGDNSLLYEIKLDDKKNKSIVEQSSKVIQEIFKVLNDRDITIFQHLLKQRSDTFFRDGVINFELENLCSEIYGYCSTTRKKEILASLTKMSLIRSKGYTKNNSGLLTSLIADIIVDVKDKVKDKTPVTVLIGLTYRNEIINGNVTKVYSYLLDEVGDNAIARKLLFFLQKERIISYYSKDKNELEKYIVKRVPYTYFSSAILFTNKNKYKILDKIEASLNLIKASNIIISKDTVRNGEFFDIYYNPISEDEIKDLEMQIETSIETQ